MKATTWLHIGLAFVLCLGLSSCAFTGSISPNIGQLPRPANAQKLPFQVGVLADPNLRLPVPQLGTIDLNPGLARALAVALAGRFESVSLIESLRQGAGLDLIAVPSLDTGANFQGFWQLKIDFSTPTGQLLSQVQYAAKADLKAFQEQQAPTFLGAFVSGLALCIPCPVTLPMLMRNNFDALVRDVADNLPLLTEGAAELARNDARLVAYTPASATSNAAKACDQADDVQKQIRACTELISKSQGRPDLQAMAYDGRGAAYMQQRDFDRALADVEQAIRLDPKSINAHYHRGRIYEAHHQYERAAQEYDRVGTLIEAAVAVKPDQRLRESGVSIRGRAAEMEARAGMEKSWVEYLTAIQASNDHENWSGPPYDLYRQSQR